MSQVSFKQILSLYPDIRSYFGSIQIGDVSGLDIISFEVDPDVLRSSLQTNCVAESRDLIEVMRRGFSINDIQYQSMKEFATEFSIADGEKRQFIFNTPEVLQKIKECVMAGMVAEKFFDDNFALMRKMSQVVFDRSSLMIIERIGSNDIAIDTLKKEFEQSVIEYTTKSDTFKVPKMVKLFSQFKGNDVELDRNLIDMVYPN
jgi:hypothetical protein